MTSIEAFTCQTESIKGKSRIKLLRESGMGKNAVWFTCQTFVYYFKPPGIRILI